VALFLRPHLEALPKGIEATIFTNTGDEYAHLGANLSLNHVPIGRERRLTGADMRSVAMLWRQFRSRKTRTVITISPKAGFVGQSAAAAAGVRQRAHIFTGQVWVDMPAGAKRWTARSADKLIGQLANHLAADSPSQARFLHHEGVAPPQKRVVVPHSPGSIRGVDLTVFRPRPEVRSALRERHRLAAEAIAFVQLGRITRSKGVMELAEAFGAVRSDWRAGLVAREPRLYLVGPDEEDLAPSLGARDGVTVLPYTPRPELLLSAMDVLVLASHREGFGSTIIEAAAVGLPAIGTDIVGVRDAIDPGLTGWLVPRGDTRALRETMTLALLDEDERRRRGAAALDRAAKLFSASDVARAYADYMMAIHEGGTP
jgi:glycosyltransferase involved in cell wall biosynthesis